MLTNRPTRFISVTLLTVGLSAALAIAPAGAAVNLLKNASFEQPVVSGAVDMPAGATLGPCANGAPYPGPDYHCWLVGSSIARLVHDDYLIGGTAVKPKAGAQFVALVATAGPAGYLPGEVQQATKVQPNTTPMIKLSYATMPTPGASSAVHLVVKACTVNGAACVTDIDTFLFSTSTGNPAKMGWKSFTAPVPVNVDEGLVEVSVASAQDPHAPIPGDPAIDAYSLK
jgi:hypothetical protein